MDLLSPSTKKLAQLQFKSQNHETKTTTGLGTNILLLLVCGFLRPVSAGTAK